MCEELKKAVREIKYELREFKKEAVKCMERVDYLETVVKDLYGQNVAKNEQHRKASVRKRKHARQTNGSASGKI